MRASGGGACFRGGVRASWGGVLPGVHASQGGVVSQHALRQTPPVNSMTDRCKNITFATSLRTVKILTYTTLFCRKTQSVY